MDVWSVASASGGEGTQTRRTDFMRAEWHWREFAGPGFTALPVVNLKFNALHYIDLSESNIWTSPFGLPSQASHLYASGHLEVSTEPQNLSYWTNLAFAFPDNYICECLNIVLLKEKVLEACDIILKEGIIE